MGRHSRKIITGGENVYPEEVEAAIRATQLVNDVVVVGLPHPEWGEIVTAIVEPVHSEISPSQFQQTIHNKISKVKIPKRWICLDKIPRNSQGKTNLKVLQDLIQDFHPVGQSTDQE